MSRRQLLLLPALLSAMALPVAPALAGEDDPSAPPAPAPEPGTVPVAAKLNVKQGCVIGSRAKVVATAPGADTVAFYLDGEHVKTVNPSSRGRAVISMRCSRLSVGAHRGSAVASYTGSQQALRFQITRARQSSPQFTG